MQIDHTRRRCLAIAGSAPTKLPFHHVPPPPPPLPPPPHCAADTRAASPRSMPAAAMPLRWLTLLAPNALVESPSTFLRRLPFTMCCLAPAAAAAQLWPAHSLWHAVPISICRPAASTALPPPVLPPLLWPTDSSALHVRHQGVSVAAATAAAAARKCCSCCCWG